MKRNGFSLVELLVVIAIIAIASGWATLNFRAWVDKSGVEAQTKEMLTDLTNARLMAIQTKKTHRVILNPRSITFRRYSTEADVAGTQVFSKNLKYEVAQFSAGAYTPFSDFTMTVSDEGYATSLPFTLAVPAAVGGDPFYNCLGVHTARVNIGRINGNNCEYK